MWWLVLAFAFCLFLFLVEDLPASRPHRLGAAGESVVSGTAVRVDRRIEVRYRHPVTDQVVRAPLYVLDGVNKPRPGDRVRVLAQHDDPLSIALFGDTLPLDEAVLVYAVVLAVAAAPLTLRRSNVRRSERLAGSDAPSFAMLGALVDVGRLHRCHLALFPLDAPPGAPSVCSFRVLTTGAAPLGAAFPVEVKGSPRPLGRVVASTRGGVLWPAGPALRPRGRHTRPYALTDARRVSPAARPTIPWQPRWWTFFAFPALFLAGTGAFAAVVTTVTVQNAEHPNRISREGRLVVAEVVAHGGEYDDVVVLRYRDETTAKTTRANVIFASDYKIGLRYPVRLDPENHGRALMDTEPYDMVSPIVFGLLPLAAVTPLFAQRCLMAARLRRAARQGPWFTVRGRRGSNDGRVEMLALLAEGETVGTLPIASLPPAAAPAAVVLAGEFEPGGVAAAWADGDALTTMGPVNAATSLSGFDGGNRSLVDRMRRRLSR